MFFRKCLKKNSVVILRRFALGRISGMRIDYYAYHSRMRNINPGIKMLLAVGTLLLTVGADRLILSLFVILTMSGVTLIMGRTPVRVYLHYMSVPLTFMLVSGFMIAAQFSGSAVGEWNLDLSLFFVCFTGESITQSVKVFCKAFAGVSALYMMSFSTPMNEIISVLQKMHMPRLLVELMGLIYRYIFILYDVAERMQVAARARLGDRSFRQSLRTFAAIAGNLFLISLKKANAYYDALLARGYDGKLEFLQEETPVKARQAIGVAVYFIMLCAVIMLSFNSRFM